MSKRVVGCYSLLETCLDCGVSDFTEGMYYGNKNLPYGQAQANQANWLVDQVAVVDEGSFLDVGCGYGRVLQVIKDRGFEEVGITLSTDQVAWGTAHDLDVRLMNYKDIPQSWNGIFDGIIANGSIEHFVQIEDANTQSKIYKEMFEIFHRILKPGGKIVTTVIHFNGTYNPEEIKRGPKHFCRCSNNYHFARLVREFGGWYPTTHQLERSAKNLFRQIHREDGTEDYHLTSESWLKAGLSNFGSPYYLSSIARKMLRHPVKGMRMFVTLFVSQSWAWQFRKKNGVTPMVLYRDVWQKV